MQRIKAQMTDDVSTSSAPPDRLDLLAFLEGRTRAWGVFEDRFRRIQRRFTAELEGYWEGGVFILDESFIFSDGSTETRIWRIVPLPGPGGEFSATCDDVVGKARGRATEDGVHLDYAFSLKSGNLAFTARFDDRYYQLDAHSVMNRAIVTKWGMKLGELSVFFQRIDRPDRGKLAA